MKFARSIMKHVLEHKLLLCIFLISVVLEVAYAVAAPVSLQYLVDEAFVPKNFDAFLIILGVLLGGGLLSICANFAGDFSLGKLSGEAIRKLRGELFAHLQKQSFPFYQRYRIGDLVTRFSADMGSIERVIRGSFPLFLRDSLSALLGLAMLFSIEWKLTLAVMAGSVLMFAGPKLVQRRAETANSNYKEAQERFANTIDEMVKGHGTIRNLHQQTRFRELAARQIRELFSFGLKVHVANSLMERLPLVALLALNGLMIGFGGYLIFNDQMTVGGFMAFFTLFMSVGQSVSNLSYLIPNLIESGVSFRRIGDIFEQKPSVPEASDPFALPGFAASIRMDRVTFGYDGQADQLKDVSLDIAAGSYVAFVGPSGSGKSTALQLLARFYDPREGAVFVDGCDLRHVGEASLRRAVTMVTQDTFLFHATVRDNLVLDNAELTEEDMIEAAKLARIHDIVAGWPEGYDTWIHREGGSLSGGERQRLAIARALLRNPQILLLDEATSALDPAAEADINGLIDNRLRDKTIVSVTHRLASVVNADNIYVFNEGRIVESGTHAELLRLGGLYADLWDKQNGFRLSRDGLRASVDAERLARLPFFAGIDLGLLGSIAELFESETCREGTELVREGDEGRQFYIIVRGKFEVAKTIAGGGEKRVAVLQDGDHFGEIALLKKIPRTATVRALVPSMLLTVRRESFHRLIEEHPQLQQTLERTLLERTSPRISR